MDSSETLLALPSPETISSLINIGKTGEVKPRAMPALKGAMQDATVVNHNTYTPIYKHQRGKTDSALKNRPIIVLEWLMESWCSLMEAVDTRK